MLNELSDKGIPHSNKKFSFNDYLLTIVVFVAYTIIIHFGLRTIGLQVMTIGYFVIGCYSWFYGLKRGLLFTLVSVVMMPTMIHYSPLTTRIFPHGLIASSAFFLTAFVTGLVSNLYQKLQITEEMYRKEHAKSELLLKSILPASIADRLKKGEVLIADRYSESTILFCDIVNFTSLAKKMEPGELVQLLNKIVTAFDDLSASYNLEKIKTIGDGYMVVSGLPERRTDHALTLAKMALKMIETIDVINQTEGMNLELKIGMHSGPVIGGVIGQSKFSFDLWGDTVNLASRLESYSLANKIQVSAQTYELIKDKFNLELRGEVAIRGYGEMSTYFLISEKTEDQIREQQQNAGASVQTIIL